ncbi:MAG: alpha/beta hydrolase family protein [Pyrinomonadaceae bacterium]
MNGMPISLFTARQFSVFQTSLAFAVALIFALVSNVRAQSPEDYAVPSNIKTEGIPTIKKADVDHLFFDPSATRSNLIWDVDRTNRTLLVTDAKTNVYRLGSPLAIPELLIDGRVPNTVRVNPKGGSFAFNDDKADADNFELYLRTNNGDVRKLSSFTGKDESVESLAWDRRGETLFYTQIDYDAKTSKVCRHDLSASQCFVSELKGIWNVIDVDDGKLLLKYWKASSNQSLHLYDLVSKRLTALNETGNAPKGFFGKGYVFWIAEAAAECSSDPCLLSMDLKTGSRKPVGLPKDINDLQDIKISPNGQSYLIQESRDGIDNLRIGKLKNSKIVDQVRPFVEGCYVIWNTRWISDTEVVYTTENVGKPASIESFDLKTRNTITWTKERVPKQFEGKTRPPEVIRWKSFDGKLISGYAIRPSAEVEKSPVLIFIHGGPQTIDRPTFNSQDLRFVANFGFTIIHTNIRGSKGFGNEFMDADNGAKRGDAIRDIRSLLDWIRTQPGLDSERVFVRGESYGGFVALAAALQEPQRIKAVIAEYPLVSIRGFLSQSWIDEFAINEYGDPKDEKLMKQLDELSPLGNASRWNSMPLFLTRGKLDARVPERDVLGLKSQLQGLGTEVWFIYANEAGHGVGGRYVTAAMYEFLKKQLRRKENK